MTAGSNRKRSADKICILYLDHTAQLSGGEIALLRILKNINTNRFRAIVGLFSEGPLRAKLETLGIKVHHFVLAQSVLQARKEDLGARSLLRIYSLLYLVKPVLELVTFIKDNNVDIVHCNSLKSDFIGGLAAKIAGVPCIWHIHDRITRDYLPPPMVFAFKLLVRLLPQFTIANSEATLATFRWTDSEQSSAVVYCGVEMHGVNSDSPDIPPEFSSQTPPLWLSQDRSSPEDDDLTSPSKKGAVTKIGIIGRISPWKGQDVFVEAAKLVHDQISNTKFYVVGSPLFGEQAFEVALHNLVAELKLGDCFEFSGFRDDVDAAIGELNVIVHASKIPEPFGQVIIEAMAAGKPVIATAGGGIDEVVLDKVTGLLVSPNNVEAMAKAMLLLIKAPDLAEEMGRAGRARVLERFTIQNTVRNVEEIYNLLQRSRRTYPYER